MKKGRSLSGIAQIIFVSFVSLKKWIINPRIIIMLAVCVFVYVFATEPLIANAGLMGEGINAIEPFTAALNSGTLLLIIPLGFLALISDFPTIDSAFMFSIFRIGRLKWMASELLRLFLMSVFYIAVIFISSVLTALPHSFWGTDWSDTVLKFAIEFPEYSQNFGAILLPKNLYNQLEIIPATLLSVAFVLLYLIFLGLILTAFSVCGKKSAGIISCGAVAAAGAALCSLKSDLMWIFPMSNSIVWLHFTEFRREPISPLYYSIIYFAAGIGLLMIFSLIKVKGIIVSASDTEGNL